MTNDPIICRWLKTQKPIITTLLVLAACLIFKPREIFRSFFPPGWEAVIKPCYYLFLFLDLVCLYIFYFLLLTIHRKSRRLMQLIILVLTIYTWNPQSWCNECSLQQSLVWDFERPNGKGPPSMEGQVGSILPAGLLLPPLEAAAEGRLTLGWREVWSGAA